MFDSLSIKDARPIAWMKRAMVAVVVALLVIRPVSAHRAYFQVRSLDLKSPELLTPGATIDVMAVCSGRNRVDIETQLIQGGHSETLFNFQVPGNNLAFFDPRPQHATRTIALTSETLAAFQPGAARLRVVAAPAARSGVVYLRQPSARWTSAFQPDRTIAPPPNPFDNSPF